MYNVGLTLKNEEPIIIKNVLSLNWKFIQNLLIIEGNNLDYFYNLKNVIFIKEFTSREAEKSQLKPARVVYKIDDDEYEIELLNFLDLQFLVEEGMIKIITSTEVYYLNDRYFKNLILYKKDCGEFEMYQGKECNHLDKSFNYNPCEEHNCNCEHGSCNDQSNQSVSENNDVSNNVEESKSPKFSFITSKEYLEMIKG